MSETIPRNPGSEDSTIADVTPETPAANDYLPVRLTNGSAFYAASSGGSVTVSNFPATQPVSAASLPLPMGAATETTLAAVQAAVEALPPDAATETTLAAVQAAVEGPITVTQTTSTSLLFFPYAAPSAAIDGFATLTATGDNALIAAGGAGTRAYITSIAATNTSGSGVRIDLKDGSTVKHSFYLAPNGGGFSHIFLYPWRLSDNTALNVAISGAVTDVRVSATGFRL